MISLPKEPRMNQKLQAGLWDGTTNPTVVAISQQLPRHDASGATEARDGRSTD